MTATLVLALVFAYEAPTPRVVVLKEPTEFASRLNTVVPSYEVNEENFVWALVRVAGDFKIAMGIEWVLTPSASAPIHVHWKNTSVRDIIEDIVRRQRGYKIEVADALVIVGPQHVIPIRENFLALRLPQFVVRKKVPEAASNSLHELVRTRVAPPEPMKGRGVGHSQGVEVGDKEISVSLADVTVRDALSAISLASPFKVWLVTFAPEGNVTPTGFRRTVSPTTGKAIADKYQPTWEVLRWGESPY